MEKETTVIVNSDTVAGLAAKIESATTALADKLGVASDHFYPIIVQQIALESWLWIWMTIPILIAATFLGFETWSEHKKGKETAGIGAWVVVLYGLSAAVFAMNIAGIINPEYYALKEITSFIK